MVYASPRDLLERRERKRDSSRSLREFDEDREKKDTKVCACCVKRIRKRLKIRQTRKLRCELPSERDRFKIPDEGSSTVVCFCRDC